MDLELSFICFKSETNISLSSSVALDEKLVLSLNKLTNGMKVLLSIYCFSKSIKSVSNNKRKTHQLFFIKLRVLQQMRRSDKCGNHFLPDFVIFWLRVTANILLTARQSSVTRIHRVISNRNSADSHK